MRWHQDVVELKARKGIDDRGRLLVEGLRAVAAAHGAGVPFEQLVYAPEFFSDDACRRLRDELAASGVPAHRVTAKEFSRLSYKAEGLVAVVRRIAPALDDVLRARVVVVLDAPSDPGNVGAVLRTANAWGASVVVVDASGKLYHPKALRASMGAVFATPTCCADRATAIARIASLGRGVVALVADATDHIDAVAFDRDVIVVLGNEKRGIDPRWLEVATARVAIPMAGVVDSLNVATAAAIVLWEAFRRR